MWRSVELVLAAALLAAVCQPAAASSLPPQPARVEVPDPLPEPDGVRVYPVAPNSFPIARVSQDRAGIATQREGQGRLDLRIDANLTFAKDSYVIRPAARARLRQLSNQLAARSSGTVEITGHTDDLGSRQHGLDLSRRRAAAVRDALAPGLSRHRVTVRGLGEARPLVPNTDEASRARNRRVEVVFRAGPR